MNATSTGLGDELNYDLIKIYPQPANEGFYVDEGNFEQESGVKLCDVTGRIVHSNNFKNKQYIYLDSTLINSGYYLHVLKNNTGEKVHRIIVEH